MKLLFKITAVIMALLMGMSPVLACTSFRLIASDGTIMVARSMEFAQDMNSNVMVSPRGKTFDFPGLSWTAEYGYVFLDGLDLGTPLDGMNEQGLSIEILLFPDEAGYQQVPKGAEKQALSYINFGDWVLGNFKTVDEVRAALKNIYVFGEKLPQLDNQIFPVHYSVFDTSGKGIVIEYVDGELNIHEHMGVMTNSPTYDWHVTNLRNYIQLSPTNPTPVIASGITYAATGQGSGMLGLPGDVSPPSRFVKMAVMLNTVIKPKDANEALNLSQHMMNTVDIPKGFVRVIDNNNTATLESTQWVVFKDLTHKKLYYRTYDNMTIQTVDLDKIDFTKASKTPL
jgi:choloylglycine hydrolase